MADRPKDIDNPIPVGPKEEAEEIRKREIEAQQDELEIGEEAIQMLRMHLEQEGHQVISAYSYPYPDGAIDFEVRVRLQERTEEEIRSVFIDVQEFLRVPVRFMVSTGFRVPTTGIEDVEDNYLVLQGLVILGAHYQTSDKIAANIQASLNNYEGLIRNGRKDPVEIFVRLFYSPIAAPPKREDYTNGIINRDETWQ